MDIDALRIFVKVAELASFTRAAEQLGLAKPRVSTAVQALEAELGARLLHRTTRRVRMTPDGEQVFELATKLLADADELQTLFQSSPAGLRGRLRVDMPVGIAARCVIPQLPGFLAMHPLLEVELSATDRRVDPVQEGFDCVLRLGELSESGLVARKLGEVPLCNAASPGYVREHGLPKSLDELAGHRLVHYAQKLGVRPVGFEHVDAQGQLQSVSMQGVITVNSSESYRAACLAGLGMIQAPAFWLRDAFAKGELVEVLPQHQAPPLPAWLLYPHRRQLSKRVSAFMAWLGPVLAPVLAPVLTS